MTAPLHGEYPAPGPACTQLDVKRIYATLRRRTSLTVHRVCRLFRLCAGDCQLVHGNMPPGQSLQLDNSVDCCSFETERMIFGPTGSCGKTLHDSAGGKG
jgi:hypothetical protein